MCKHQASVYEIAKYSYELTLPWKSLVLLLLAIPLADIAFRTISTRGGASNSLLGLLLIVDISVLTGLLYCTGGDGRTCKAVRDLEQDGHHHRCNKAACC